MHASSTSSSAYPSRRHGASAMASSSSSSRHPDERLSNGPLTSERAMMEQIRSKLERTQRRMARERAVGSSQHGYNSARAMPMSGMSHHHHHHHAEYPSSSRHTHSQNTHQHHVSSSTHTTMGTTANYRSGRAPAVPSVYLEDLPLAIHSSQRAPPPSSRAPTSYAPGGGTASTAGSYYAPELDESLVRAHPSTRTRPVRSQHFEAAPVASHVHVRSERHAVHHLQQQQRSHHQQHHQAAANEMTASHHGHHDHQHHHPRHDERPRVARPPPSTRGILRKTSSSSSAQPPPPSATMPLYYGNENAPPSNYRAAGYTSSHHSSVPLSSNHRQHPRPPRTSHGQPPRSALKQQRSEVAAPVASSRAREDNDTAESDASAFAAPPPSSRVRFEDELRAAIAYPPLVEEDEDAGDDSDGSAEQPLEFLGEELPYDPQDDLEYHDNDDEDEDEDEGDYYGGDYDTGAYPYAVPVEEDAAADFEPVVEIKQTHALAERVDESVSPRPVQVTNTDGSPMAAPASPHQKAKPSTKDLAVVPHRRRGSSAARTPPNLSPSASYARKSLTEPPKSAIDASLFDQFDMRERRASKEKHVAHTSRADVDIDALAASALEASKPLEPQGGGGDEFATTNMGAFASSPFAIYDAGSDSDYGDLSDGSQGSLHESHLAFDDDDVPSVPPPSFIPYRRSNVSDKLSPSSTDDYSDAHTFPDEEEAPHAAACASAPPTPSNDATGGSSPLAPETPLSDQQKHCWHVDAGTGASDEGDQATHTAPLETETPPATETKQAPARPPKLRSSQAPYFGFQPRNTNAFAYSSIAATTTTTAPSPESPASSSPASPPSSPETAPTRPRPQQHQRPAAVVRETVHHHDDRAHHHHGLSSRKPMPLSQSLMMLAPPPSAARSGHRPPPASTHIRPSPATARMSSSMASSTTGGIPRAPVTTDGSLAGSTYVPRRFRPKTPASRARKALPPSIGALSGLASGPVTFELDVASFYEVEWTTGEFGFSFQRVYLEETDDEADTATRRMFLRMLLNTERGTCPSFRQVHLGDVLVEIDGTRVCDIKLDKNGGGAALTKLFTELRTQTPLRLVFQRMDPTSWEGGVEL